MQVQVEAVTAPVAARSDSVGSTGASGRRLLAVFPPIAALLLAMGVALAPKGLNQPITGMDTALRELPIAAAHPGQLYVSSVLGIFGLGAMAVAFAAIATLARHRGFGLARTAAAIGGFACLCGVVVAVLIGFDLAGAATADATTRAAARVLVSINTAWASTALLIAYVGGLVVASLLAGVALWRSRAVARWIAVAFPVSIAVAAWAPAGIIAVPLQVPVAVVMVVLATRIWRAANPDPAGSRRLAAPADC